MLCSDVGELFRALPYATRGEVRFLGNYSLQGKDVNSALRVSRCLS